MPRSLMVEPMEPDFQRSFGKLESKVDSIAESMGLMIAELRTQQASSRKDRRRLHVRINKLITDHIVDTHRLTELLDRVEGQGKAITELEAFQDRAREQDLKEKVTVSTNRRWIKGLI